MTAIQEWISTENRLPECGIYVLVHYAGNNWIDKGDPAGVYFVVAKREESGNPSGNNEKPYKWITFGPTGFFGQDIDYWMPFPRLSLLKSEHKI